MMRMEYSSIDNLFILGMYETMCFQSGSNNNNRWYMDNDVLRFTFGKNLEDGDRVQYHYA